MNLPHPRMRKGLALNPDRAVIEALGRLITERPELGSLVDHLVITDRGIALPDAFFEAYRSSAAPLRTHVLRAVLADASLFRKPLADTLTPPLARRFMAYLRALPEQPLLTGDCGKDLLPKSMRRWFGLTPSQGWLDFVDALTLPLWEVATTGAAVSVPAHANDWPAASWAALQPVLTSRYLTEANAQSAIAAGLTTRFLRYFFESPVAPLNERNVLVFLGTLLSEARRSGREQNLIPLQFSRRFNLPPRSVPATLAMLDVLSLVYAGVAAVPAADPFAIGSLFDVPVPESRDRFWAPAIEPHRRRWLVNAGYEPDDAAGMFDSGLLFNAARATALVPGRNARLAMFSDYYAAVGRQALWEHCMPEWASISPANRSRCGALLDYADDTPAIRLRDLGNIVSLRSLYGAEVGLPPVARYALGMPEPEPSLLPTGYTGRTRSGEGTGPRPFRALEELIRTLDATPDEAIPGPGPVIGSRRDGTIG